MLLKSAAPQFFTCAAVFKILKDLILYMPTSVLNLRSDAPIFRLLLHKRKPTSRHVTTDLEVDPAAPIRVETLEEGHNFRLTQA